MTESLLECFKRRHKPLHRSQIYIAACDMPQAVTNRHKLSHRSQMHIVLCDMTQVVTHHQKPSHWSQMYIARFEVLGPFSLRGCLPHSTFPVVRRMQLLTCVHVCSAAKFNGVHALDIHFPESLGADCTEIYFLGIKGEFYEVTHCVTVHRCPSTCVAIFALYDLLPCAWPWTWC